jgi:hypothetical protein
MLLLEGYTYLKFYVRYAEFNDFFVNQSLAGQTIQV